MAGTVPVTDSNGWHRTALLKSDTRRTAHRYKVAWDLVLVLCVFLHTVQ